MTKQMLSVRVSPETMRQLLELAQRRGDTQTGVVAIAIDRMYREEMSREDKPQQ